MSNIQLRSSNVPFKVSRDFIAQVLDEVEQSRLQLPLRPILHTSVTEEGSLSDRQLPRDQLRFYTRDRCLRDFRLLAQYLINKGQCLKVILDVLPHKADLEFFEVLTSSGAVILHTKSVSQCIEDKYSDSDIMRLFRKPLNENEWRIINDRITYLLNCGDSWTSTWLCDNILQSQAQIPSFIYNNIGLSYCLQNRTMEAEKFFKYWGDAGGIEFARANYSRAMLYARHHPVGLRNQEKAKSLLKSAWETLLELDTSEEIIYERIFNRNGYALILYREKKYKEAANLLEESVKKINETKFQSGVHHTVLLNNLGRIYAAMGRSEEAERTLLKCVDLDPKFAEYWFDLATFYADIDRLSDAIDAAREAEKCSSTIADIPALLGYISLLADEPKNAIDYYIKAWNIEPRSEFALSAAQAWSEFDDYSEVKYWLKLAYQSGISEEQSETFDILQLEVDLQDIGDNAREIAIERLTVLAAKYPNSEVIRDNLEYFGI